VFTISMGSPRAKINLIHYAVRVAYPYILILNS